MEEKIKKEKFNISNIYILLGILAAIIILFSILSKTFYSLNNLQSLLVDASWIAIIASALTLNLIGGEIDLSIGSNIGLTSCVVAIAYANGINIWICILIGILIGLTVGLFNATIIVGLGVNSLIVTIGTMAVLKGIAFTITGNKSILIMEDVLGFLGRGKIGGIPTALVLAIIVYILFEIILKSTKFGREIQITGSNKDVAYLSGIKYKRVKYITLILCGLSASIGGLIITSITAVGMPQHGMGMELVVISAVLLGGTAFTGGKGSVTGTMAAVLIMSIIYNGLTILNVSSFITQIIKGALLVLIVSAYEIRENRSRVTS